MTIKYQQISVLSYEHGKARRYRATEMESGLISNLRPAPVRLVIGGGFGNVEIIDALQTFLDEINELENELPTGEAA